LSDDGHRCLVLGIGNVLMGDEGIGVRVVEVFEREPLPPGAAFLDGGTGGFHLLGAMQEAQEVVLVDATLDGRSPGAVERLQPRFSTDYPSTLTAHDIGLKDLLDAMYLLGNPPRITLFAVSIPPPTGMSTELTPDLAVLVPGIAARVRAEVERILSADSR
jgi:hydrogenase maturation protease